jgi:hypothetical protein
MEFKKRGWEDVDWINLAMDREHWQALLNMAIHIWFHIMVEFLQ